MPIKVELDDNAAQGFYVLLGGLFNLLLSPERGMVKSPVIIVARSLSSISFCFIYFEVCVCVCVCACVCACGCACVHCVCGHVCAYACVWVCA